MFSFFNLLLTGALKDAFSHCRSVEKTAAFNDSIEWLQCAVDIFDSYQEENGLNIFYKQNSTLILYA